ncbi:MAG: S8 family serine peptidase [Bdellovibrionales bacterium]|nr:S8 family serine peptidase [Bdellovibrionales bacterium]
MSATSLIKLMALTGVLVNPWFSNSWAQQTMADRSWGLQAKSGIDAPHAWTQMKSDCSKSGIVVAVIDTGIDMNHPALKSVLWNNPKVGRDGYSGDLHGWDFAKNSGNLVDNHGHGTHIAGIIAGRDVGVGGYKGVCPGVRIMALRYYDENASGVENLRNTVKAINYAVDHNADIINYSGGGAEFSEAEFKALKRAEAKGILVVAAAGNERSNADTNLYFPAAYPLNNIISVTAVDESGAVLSAANWGIKKVHVAAPGQSILSTLPNGGYGFMSGTSQATAFVSGIAAMLLSENHGLNFKQIKSIIESSVLKYPQLVGKAKTSGRVNAYNALKLLGAARSVSSSH